MSNLPDFKFSSNIYSQNLRDPRSGISAASAASVDVALFWEQKNEQHNRPLTVAHTRDHLKEMWALPNNRRSSQSKYRETFGNSEDVNKGLHESERIHYKKKDWLKSYFESMHKQHKFSKKV